jgi:predicted GNAT superfamily acetyltransferase
LLIEIPGSVEALGREPRGLIPAWRRATRGAFTRALAAGFVVAEFYAHAGGGGVYLLTSETSIEELES